LIELMAGYILEHAAILARCDLTFGTTVQVVENRPRQSAAG
jgi:hypothetical protein